MKKMKAMLREIKKNVQGTNSEGKETGTQINGLEKKEEINIQPEQNKDNKNSKKKKKMRTGLGTSDLQNNLKHSNN